MAPPRTGKKQAAKHIAIYSAGSILRQLAGFIMLPIYTSYLSPSDYGVVGLLVVMIGLFELVMGARFAQAVPKFYYEYEDDAGRNTVVTTALFLTSFVSLFATGLVALGSEPVAKVLFGSAEFQQHVALYCVLLLTTAIEAYGLTFLRLQEKPVLYILNSIGKLITQLSLNILFVVYYEMGVMGVIYSGLISSSAFALISMIYILWHTGFNFSGSLTVRLVRFSWPLWLAGIAGLYVASSNRYFIRIFSDLDQVGLYELATKFAAILPMLIWSPFSQWWQTERFKLYQTPDRGVSVFPVVFNGIATVMVIAATGLSLFGGPVIEIMSSAAFHPAAAAVPVLVYGVLLGNLRFFFFFSFLVTENTIIITYIKYGSAVIATLLYFALIPSFGYLGAAYAVLLSEAFVLTASYLLSKRYFDNGITPGYVALLIAGSVCLIGIDNLFLKLEDPLLTRLAVKILLFSIVLLLSAILIWRNPDLRKLASQALRAIKVKFNRSRAVKP